MDKLIFCPECREEVGFKIKDEDDTTKLNGKTCQFISQNAYCDTCGSELWVPELHDENLKRLYEVYNK